MDSSVYICDAHVQCTKFGKQNRTKIIEKEQKKLLQNHWQKTIKGPHEFLKHQKRGQTYLQTSKRQVKTYKFIGKNDERATIKLTNPKNAAKILSKGSKKNKKNCWQIEVGVGVCTRVMKGVAYHCW